MDKKLQIILILVIAIYAGYYIYTDMVSVSTVDKEPTTESSGIVSIEGEGEGDYTIEIIPTNNNDNSANIPVPDLDRAVVFAVDISAETQGKLKQKIEEVSSELKQDSNLVDKWIELGVYRKTIGDYDGAVDVLKYALVLQPNSRTAYHNLGDLYGYYLNDPKQAEENFLKAIELVPSDIYLYFKITEFYREVLNDVEKARQIVEQGIEANPSSEDLKSLLKSLNNIT